jgi:DNA-binding transcriptional ArsR family regulator
MGSTGSSWDEVERNLGNRGRLRIFKALYDSLPSPLTKYKLVKETGLSQAEVKRHLETLVEAGWVLKGSLMPTTYCLNLVNLLVKSFVGFLEAIGSGFGQ